MKAGVAKDKPGPADNEVPLTVGEEEFKLLAYKETPARKIMFYALSIMTLGFYRLFAHWYKNLYAAIRTRPCCHEDADYVMIVDNHDVRTIKRVREEVYPEGVSKPTRSGNVETCSIIRAFSYRKIKYIWYEKEREWINPSDLDSTAPFSNYLKRIDDELGLHDSDVQKKRVVYGLNSLAVELTPLLMVLIMEVLTPFYLFQLASVILWYIDDYAYYASVIVIITVGSAIIAVWQTRVQERKVKEMVGTSMKVTLVREGTNIAVDATEIVPGDIILLPSDEFILPCDALLLNGSAIVNEAMLTGESVPVTKVPLSGADDQSDDVRFSPEKHNRHTLFCGTTVLQTRYYGGKPVLALAVRTGFSTLKGQLVRSIMYPKPMDPQYMADLFKFIAFLASIAGCGFIYTITIMLMRREQIGHIIIRSLDIITIVVPPALPAAMSVGTINANVRLRKLDIFCISPSTINVCGQINVVAFDKTGTLTEDGMDFNTLRAIRRTENRTPEFTEEIMDLDPEIMSADGANIDIINAAATCHSLTRIDGKIHGDPLDLILFQKSKWALEEGVGKETELFDNVQPTLLKPPQEHMKYHYHCGEYSVIRQFTFSSALQRMSVIVSNPSEDTAHDMTIYTKGSPEMIGSLCDPSTIPANYTNIVDAYAQRGFRLISVASKKIELNFVKAAKAPRSMLECDLKFLGLVVMENRLKPVTLDVINTLFTSAIRCVMVTGDNLLTAMSVARECGIIRPTKKAFLITHDTNRKDDRGRTLLTITESVSSSEAEVDTDSTVRDFDRKLHLQLSKYHLAIAGPTYKVICHEYPELVDRITAVCDVYARMAPDQKSGLILALQEVGYKVAMCGDGANDCAALKAADAGISLSDAEASIAAPFTSKTPDIRCVVEVIKEGRCALVTSFAVFKYMAAYSLNEFLTVMLLYWFDTNITDGQFLYIDFVLITIVALFLGNTGPATKLSIIPPPARLMTLCSVFSVVGQLVINCLCQVVTLQFVRSQPWYHKYQKDPESLNCQEGTALFAASFLYLAFAFVYSKGAPYRRNVFTNWKLCICVVIIGILTGVIILVPAAWIESLMGFDPLPSIEFRLILIGESILFSGMSILYEYVIVQILVADIMGRKFRARKLRRNDPSLPLFERLLASIGQTADWFERSIHVDKMQMGYINEATTEF